MELLNILSDKRLAQPMDTRKPSVKVIAAGLPRCATTSLQAALESPFLEIAPCMHGKQIFPRADRMMLVLKAMRETDTACRREILHELFDGYAATVDIPGIFFIDDLMDMYPDARVILNVRPGPQDRRGESWAKSIRDALSFFASWRYILNNGLLKISRLHWRMHREIYPMFSTQAKFQLLEAGGSGADWMTAEFYEKYNAWVHAEAAKRGREVLEFDPTMGWGPLCEFLGKSEKAITPHVPFPHRNDAQQVAIIKRQVITLGLLLWAGAIVSLVLLLHIGLLVANSASPFADAR